MYNTIARIRFPSPAIIRHSTVSGFGANDRKRCRQRDVGNVVFSGDLPAALGSSSPTASSRAGERKPCHEITIIRRSYIGAASRQESCVHSVIIIDRLGPILKWSGTSLYVYAGSSEKP